MKMHLILLPFIIMVSQTVLGESLANQSSLTPGSSNSAQETAKNAAEPKVIKPNPVMSLGAVTTEVDGDLTIVTARLNRSPDWKNIELEEHGTFLQVKLPQTLIPASGEFFDGNGPFLRKLASFQLGGDDGALRLFVNQDASKAKLASSAELLGDRIVITIDHKKLEQLITPATKSTGVESGNVASSAAIQEESGKTLTAATSASATTNPAPTSSDNRTLHEQLTKGAAICAILFMSLVALQMFKSRRLRKKHHSRNVPHVEPVAMKVLSSISLGQKQKLTLVQVGSQQILLGLTPDNINLLTNIEDKSSNSAFSRALESANPNAEVRLKNPAEIGGGAMRKTLTAPAVKGRSIGGSRGSNINVAIGEDGPVEIKPAKSDEDITKILRDRLRNLPPG